MIPFVTDELWTALNGGESVMIEPWPVAQPGHHAPAATADIELVQSVVGELRRFRSDQGVKPAQRVPARISGLSDSTEPAVRALLRLDPPSDGFTATASLTTARGVTVDLDLSTAVDVAAERARLTKDRAAAVKERDVNAAKLANDAFVGKAPPAVVSKVRERLAAADAELARIDAALAALPPS
jgi:valyl-tRNA synthetase